MQGKERVDLIDDFAAAIPVEVIGNLLAVPREARAPLRGWSLAILGALEPVPTEAMLERGNRSVREFGAFLGTLIADRRAHPLDAGEDVLTRLVRGEGDETRRVFPSPIASTSRASPTGTSRSATAIMPVRG